MKNFETVWTFDTLRFRVALQITPEYSYGYDGDDLDGETQAKLDDGSLSAFVARVVVMLDGEEIASDCLGGCVYDSNSLRDFWTSHRTSIPEFRNCSAMRATHGQHTVICHYFPDMVREACRAARLHFAHAPKLRAA